MLSVKSLVGLGDVEKALAHFRNGATEDEIRSSLVQQYSSFSEETKNFLVPQRGVHAHLCFLVSQQKAVRLNNSDNPAVYCAIN